MGNNNSDKLISVVTDPKGYPIVDDGSVLLIQSRSGYYLLAEHKDDKPKALVPKLLSLCQFCNRTNCKHHRELKPFSMCSIYIPVTEEEARRIGLEIMQSIATTDKE